MKYCSEWDWVVRKLRRKNSYTTIHTTALSWRGGRKKALAETQKVKEKLDVGSDGDIPPPIDKNHLIQDSDVKFLFCEICVKNTVKFY